MKNITIIIAKAASFRDVAVNTAYTGAKNSSLPEFFDKVATISQDDEILGRFWTEMCGKITDRFKEFPLSSTIGDEAFTLSLELSGSYDDSLTQSVADDIKAALSAGVTARWFAYTCPEKTDEWLRQSDTLLASALSKLCQRRRPLRHS